jgi:hypothetical protein
MRKYEQIGTGMRGIYNGKVPVSNSSNEPAIIISILITVPNSFGWMSKYLFFLCLTTLSVTGAIWRRTVFRLINMKWKGSGKKRACIESLCCNLPEGTHGKLLKTSVLPRLSFEPFTSREEVQKHYKLVKFSRWYKKTFLSLSFPTDGKQCSPYHSSTSSAINRYTVSPRSGKNWIFQNCSLPVPLTERITPFPTRNL